MLQMLVIADDFTGALDTGVQFAKQGFYTQVATGQAPGFDSAAPWTQVLVADTQSRHIPASEAYRLVHAWAAAARRAGIPLLYKKTDSTLRGNVGAELAAALHGAGRRALVFIPAYPRLGRTVRGGSVRVHGVPLDQTDFARDPFTPVRHHKVADILSESAEAPVSVTGPAGLGAMLEAKDGAGIIAVDAETDAELAEIAAALAPHRETVVLAGCAGFAEMLPGMMGAPAMPETPIRKAGTMLFVCGSVNAVSIAQAEAARAAGVPSVRLEPAQLLDKDFLASPSGRAFLNDVRRELETNRCLMLRTAENAGQVRETAARARRLGIPAGRLHLIIAEHLGAAVVRVLKEQLVDVLAVFGGDTLHGIVRCLRGQAVFPEREIFPGIVQSVLQTPEGDRVIVSKAGGFGETDVICALRDTYIS